LLAGPDLLADLALKGIKTARRDDGPFYWQAVIVSLRRKEDDFYS
jgi:hypothetical protein